MKLFLIGFTTLIIGASCQIYTQIGEDGYKYPKPQARFDLPEPIAAEPACSNGGSGLYCCTNGAENTDCCTNGGRGKFCCLNGADNSDCCENGGRGKYCCTNGVDTENCELPTPPPLPSFVPVFDFPKIIPVKPAPQPIQNTIVETPKTFVPSQSPPPPLPSFIPVFDLPKIIPVKPAALPVENTIAQVPESSFVLNSFAQFPSLPKMSPLVISTPSPFIPAPLPVKPADIPQIQARTFDATTKSPNEYLPPIDVRINEMPDWSSWKKKYNKRYATPEEDKHREAIFTDNVIQIVSLNNEFDAGLIPYELDANKFSDLTKDEFLVQHTGLRRDSRSMEGHSTMNVFMPSPMLDMMVEDEVDWRKKGAVTPVKNQGSCASCWAFAANGALEAQNFLAKGKLVSLSEQNLIDCVKENDGCDGGYMTNAYDYVRTNPGVDTESSYPYEARNTTCRFDPKNVGGECMAHMEIMIGNEKALLQAVATVGPVAAGIDASKRSFQFYKSGYYFEPTCDTEVNHAVVIVGYGKTEQGEEYWICKNSWDTDWGEEGYIRMARNKNNHCGITSLASYPLV